VRFDIYLYTGTNYRTYTYLTYAGAHRCRLVATITISKVRHARTHARTGLYKIYIYNMHNGRTHIYT